MASAAAAAWVLDVSVAAKWFLRDEALLDRADRVLTDFSNGVLGLIAPAYFLDEAGNILRTAVRRSRISADLARREFATLLRLGVVIAEPTPERRTSAFDLALIHDIAYYDALYLQLAQELRLPILTADRAFHERISQTIPTPMYLGDADW